MRGSRAPARSAGSLAIETAVFTLLVRHPGLPLLSPPHLAGAPPRAVALAVIVTTAEMEPPHTEAAFDFSQILSHRTQQREPRRTLPRRASSPSRCERPASAPRPRRHAPVRCERGVHHSASRYARSARPPWRCSCQQRGFGAMVCCLPLHSQAPVLPVWGDGLLPPATLPGPRFARSFFLAAFVAVLAPCGLSAERAFALSLV